MKKILSFILSVIMLFSVCMVGANAYEEKQYTTADGIYAVTIEDNEITIQKFTPAEGVTSITVPSSFDNMPVVSIGNYAFSGYLEPKCAAITSITIPNSVKTVENDVFHGCSNLTEVIIPNSVTSIGYQVFFECTSLETITIPESVTSIGSYLFYGCSALEEIVIPDGVSKIEKYTFFGCTFLTNITLGKGITKIDEYAFNGCSDHTVIIYPLCKNMLNRIDGKEYIADKVTYLSCKCTNPKYISYHDGSHREIKVCDMCRETISDGVFPCAINGNGICPRCNYDSRKQIKIKASSANSSMTVVSMPDYSSVKNVPEGLEVVGYWYKDGKTVIKLEEGDTIPDGITTFYTTCKLSTRFVGIDKLINYISYLITDMFYKIF